MVQKISGNIAETSCSVMVNAANGVGYMGGKRCAKMLCRGVSETMLFATHGLIEKDARKSVKTHGILRAIIGLDPGNYFVTGPCGLPCTYVFHAITMRFPGSRSKVSWVKHCLLNLKSFCKDHKLYDIALPYIGCGNGAVPKEILEELVITIFSESFWDIKLVDYVGT